jgi:hypothetical protein
MFRCAGGAYHAVDTYWRVIIKHGVSKSPFGKVEIPKTRPGNSQTKCVGFHSRNTGLDTSVLEAKENKIYGSHRLVCPENQKKSETRAQINVWRV